MTSLFGNYFLLCAEKYKPFQLLPCHFNAQLVARLRRIYFKLCFTVAELRCELCS